MISIITPSMRSSSAAFPAAKPRSMTNLSPCPTASTDAAAISSAMPAKITCFLYGRTNRPTRASDEERRGVERANRSNRRALDNASERIEEQ